MLISREEVEGPFPPPTKTEMKAHRDQARAHAEWLRQLAEKAKAELDAASRED